VIKSRRADAPREHSLIAARQRAHQLGAEASNLRAKMEDRAAAA
jgi:hypothetical protein